MIDLHRFRQPQRRLALLLWLALLLPLAQAAATWHGYSHFGPQASSHDDGKQLAHDAHCDLCLTAAGLAGGALVDTAASPREPELHDTLPGVVVAHTYAARLTPAYRSRAPPRT